MSATIASSFSTLGAGGDCEIYEKQSLDRLTQSAKSGEFDVGFLEQIVHAVHHTHGHEQKFASSILTQFKDYEEAWAMVDSILARTTSQETRYFALQVLEEAVKKRWKSFPQEQCEAVKKYVTNLIITLCVEGSSSRLELARLNGVLIEIVKYEWPNRWPNFVSDLVRSSYTGESICQNNMYILRLLSQEVFDFAGNSLTLAKAQALRKSMCQEFSEIFDLCLQVLAKCSEQTSLVQTTLETLLIFISWIPHGYLLETNLINILAERYMSTAPFRNVTVKCMAEIAAVNATNLPAEPIVQLLKQSMNCISELIPDSVDVQAAYNSSHDSEKDFIMSLTMFISTLLKHQQNVIEAHIENSSDAEAEKCLERALSMMVRLSRVDEVEVFKVCIEYWISLSTELLKRFDDNLDEMVALRPKDRDLYGSVLSHVRLILIERMARPEEVIIVEAENGEVVREFFKDTDAITLYKNMRDCLCNLTNIDASETVNIMTSKLQQQASGDGFTWNGLNTLCWAIGSVSGTLSEDEERRFLVYVIKELLGLCEQKRGKDNKAIVAANIMYVVGQHPRFLRAHWKFLKTVASKLFEFMHESHEGVQDMACDTFIKISTECKRHFICMQSNEHTPFVYEIIDGISSIICDLSPQQTQTFYEALAHILSSCEENTVKRELIQRAMYLPNSAWEQFVLIGKSGSNEWMSPPMLSHAVGLIRINRRACRPIGADFVTQIAYIFDSLLFAYEQASIAIKSALTPHVKSLKSLRNEILGLFRDWMSSCVHSLGDNELVTRLFALILPDYASGGTEREVEVLALVTCFVQSGVGGDRAFDYFASVFEPTLKMIEPNVEDFPEFRHALYHLLLAVIEHAFDAIIRLSSSQFRFLYESFGYALRHTDRNIVELGFDCMIKLFENFILRNYQDEAFYREYLAPTIDLTFRILSETSISTGLSRHARLLMTLFSTVEALPFSLSGQNTSNSIHIKQHLALLFRQDLFAAQLQDEAQIKVLVDGFFNYDQDCEKFKSHLRDFLVEIRRHTGSDTSDLYLEEREHELEKAAREKELAKPQQIYHIRRGQEAVAGVPGELDDDED